MSIRFPKRKLLKAAFLNWETLTFLLSLIGLCSIASFFSWNSPLPYCLISLGFVLHYYFGPGSQTTIYHNDSPSHHRILSHMPCLRGRGYQPTPYLTNPDVQTLLGQMGRRLPGVAYEREKTRAAYQDGEVAVFDWAWADEKLAQKAAEEWSSSLRSFSSATDYLQQLSKLVAPSTNGEFPQATCNRPRFVPRGTPVVIVFHGLTLAGRDLTMDYVVHRINQQGWHAVVPIRRGCSDDTNDLTHPKFYAYGGLEDSAHVVAYIAKKMPNHPIFAVGLSAGSNVMSNYIASAGENSQILGAISVANGYCFEKGTTTARDDHPVWDIVMSTLVHHSLYARHEVMRTEMNGKNSDQEVFIPNATPVTKRPTSFRALDEWVSRRIHGYESLGQFYAAQSCEHRLHRVRVPMLFTNAYDDALASRKCWPVEVLNDNPDIIFVTTPGGGHLGYYQGWFPFRTSSETWLEQFVVQGLRGIMSEAKSRLSHSQSPRLTLPGEPASPEAPLPVPSRQ